METSKRKKIFEVIIKAVIAVVSLLTGITLG